MAFFDLFLGALLAFAATTAGAALVLPAKALKDSMYALLIAFSAGVMAYSAWEMFLQSIKLMGIAPTLGWLAAGAFLFYIIDRLLPHAHAFVNRVPHHTLPHEKRKAALLAGTITIHNIPEGFAIASAFAASSPLGWLVATTIAVQDVPEGLFVSAPLTAYGIGNRHSFLWGAFSGLVEFLAAIFGFLFLSVIVAATPLALAFSSGAMSFVTFSELLPDSFRAGNKLQAAAAFVAGVALAYGLALIFALPK